MAKVVTTKKLKLLVGEARERKFNRVIKDEVLRRLDPVGKHVMSSFTILHNDDAVVRVPIMMKVEGSTVPIERVLDVSLESYLKIPTYKE